MSRRQRNRSSEEEEYASSQFPTPPASRSSLSPPEAKRIRRTHGSSLSSSTSTMTPRNNFDIRNEDYRSIGPIYLPLPTLNAAGVGLNRQREWDRGLDGQVKSILNKHNVQWTSCELVRRQSVLPTTPASPPIDSIFVLAKKILPDANIWADAAGEILSMCQKNSTTKDLNVEIADARGLVPTVSRPVPVSEPFVKEWDRASIAITKCFGKNKDMLSLNLLHRGKATLVEGAPREHSFTPTIVLLIRRESRESWSEVREAIVKLLGNQYGNVAVEILRGEANPLMNDEATCAGIHHGTKLWQKVAYMGASVGTKEPHDSGFPNTNGTLGCFLQLKNHQRTKVVGLTNFHVAIAMANDNDQDPLQEQPTRYQALFAKGSVMGTANASQIPIPCMMMPTKDDSGDALEWYSRQIATVKAGPVYQEVDALVQENPGTDPADLILRSKIATYEQHNRMIKQYRDSIETATQNDKGDQAVLGKVFAVSGARVDREQWNMDWALVDIVQSRRPAYNDLIEASTFGEALLYPGRVMVNAALDRMADAAPMEQVFKIGRTTAKTTGWVNPAKSIDFHGFDDSGTLKQARACVVTPLPPYDPSKDVIKSPFTAYPPSFSKRGDSGSAVFSKDGVLHGILFAGVDITGVSSFIPITALVADIKKITGASEVKLLGAA